MVHEAISLGGGGGGGWGVPVVPKLETGLGFRGFGVEGLGLGAFGVWSLGFGAWGLGKF